MRPAFAPRPMPLGNFLAFICHPDGWGMDHAALHGDDFDEVLASIPMEADSWHIYAKETGRIVAGSNPEKDRTYEPDPGGRAVILQHSDRESESDWGAWSIERSVDNLDEAIEYAENHSEDSLIQVLDFENSSVRYFDGSEDRVIPSLEQLKNYESDLAEWLLEQQALGLEVGGKEDVVTEARASALMGSSVLPSNWADLSDEELRVAVEKAEAHITATTGKTPLELKQSKEAAEELLDEHGSQAVIE